MDALIRDVKQAFRLLSSNRGFAVSALVTIAVGVGGTAAVFSVVYGVLLRPLPYPEPHSVVRLSEVHPGANAPFGGALLSHPTYRAWSRTPASLQEIGAFLVSDYMVTGLSDARRLQGTKVTPSVFRVLRVSPAVGRFFTDADAQPGSPPVVVLAYGAWREQFGGSPAALGKALTIDSVDHQIIGVAPPAFVFPRYEGSWSDSPREVRLYTPFVIPEVEPTARVIDIVDAIGRLAPGVTVAEAEAEGTAYARSVARPNADMVFGSGGPVEVRVRSIVDHLTMRVQPALVVLAAAIGLVLLIACANVANLFLSRGADRARELAVRAALGASRGRLIRQLLTESIVVSLIGGVLGVFVGWGLAAAVPALAPAGFPRLDDIHVDLWFLIAATSAAVFVGTVSGVLPAIRSSRLDLGAAMQTGGKGNVGTSGGRVRRVLLVVEAAVAVVLLIGATLLARSFVKLVEVDVGYNPANVITADLYTVGASDTGKRASQIAVSTVERIRATSGVIAAGAGNMVPLGGALSSASFALPGMITTDGRPVLARAFLASVTPGYAEALGMRVKEGRFFRPEDTTSRVQPLLVNEAFEKAYFTDGRPITGRRFIGMFPRMLGRTDAVFDVVGVVRNVLTDPGAQPQPQIYVVHGGGLDMPSRSLVVKTEGDPAAAVATLRGIVRQLDPGATLDRVSLLADKISSSVGEPRFAAFVLTTFSLLALVLSTTGLYGVLSYNVTQRRREIGVRVALGATNRNLVSMVLREGLSVTVIGLVFGIVAAAAGARTMRNLLFVITPWDRTAFSVGPILLLLVASAACLIPARRAASIDPAEALKAE
jgi:putative ABC transport system permease protein